MRITLEKISQMVSKINIKELKEKQATPYGNMLEEDPMKEIKATRSNPKWKLEVKVSPNPSQGILGFFPNSNKIVIQKIKRIKGVIYDNSRQEKKIMRRDARGL